LGTATHRHFISVLYYATVMVSMRLMITGMPRPTCVEQASATVMKRKWLAATLTRGTHSSTSLERLRGFALIAAFMLDSSLLTTNEEISQPLSAYCFWTHVIGCFDLPNHDFVEPKSRPAVPLRKEDSLDVYPAARDQSCAW
jgi:hypothetical protein